MTIRGTMRVRGGFFAILAFLCVMIAVIAVGTGPDTSSSTELASAESLVVGASDEHDHAEGENHADGDHAHADGDHADGDHADGDHADGAHADGEDHGHADGADHAAGAHTDGDHAHDPTDPGHAEDPNHAHPTVPGEPPHPHPTVPGEPPHPHPTEPPPGPTYTQVQLDLLAATQAWISPRFATTQAAYNAGYRSIGDSSTGWEHFVNSEFLGSPDVLNPERIESLVYRVNGAQRTLASGMYILPIGQTLANVPGAFNTPQTPWHIHTNLCWALNPIRVVGITNSGAAGCPPGSIYFPTPPMLHVWVDEQQCGWFSDLEQVETSDCNAHPH